MTQKYNLRMFKKAWILLERLFATDRLILKNWDQQCIHSSIERLFRKTDDRIFYHDNYFSINLHS